MSISKETNQNTKLPGKKTAIPELDLQYQYWLYQKRIIESDIKKMKDEIETLQFKPKIGIIMPVYDVDDEILRKAIDSVLNQVYPYWELCITDDASTKTHIKKTLKEYGSKDSRIKTTFLEKNEGIAGASNHSLSLCTSEYVGFLDNDDELYLNTLYEIAKLLNKDRDAEIIYTDEDKIDYDERRIEPTFKPDWSPDLLLSFQYITHFVIYKKKLLDELSGLRLGYDGSQDYDLILRATEKTKKISHIPLPLYGWRKIPGSTSENSLAKGSAHVAAKKAIEDAIKRRSMSGNVENLSLPGLFRVKYGLKENALVSIIIISHDNKKTLESCIQSIEKKTSYKNYEIIIVDHRSTKKETLDYLKKMNHKVIRYDDEFNYSRILNYAVKSANGKHLLFMNDDMMVINEDWLTALLEHSQREDVGAVGSLLLYPKERGNNLAGLIQHAGLVLGSKSAAGHVFYKHNPETNSYRNLHRVIHNVIAVTGACMMIKKKIFDELNGFDENLKISHNDVDLCLRINKAGYSVVFTPFSQVYHFEGQTRGHDEITEDEQTFIDKWKEKFLEGDPFYNCNLSLIHQDFTISRFPHRNPAMSSLMEVFYHRSDLQKFFPEADQGDYSKLMGWAIKHGAIEHPPLRPYVTWYQKSMGITNR